MSKDFATSGPSRRSIAKGAAWAVPAVTVAAAAPALAASPTDACAPGTLQVSVVNCQPLGLFTEPPYFQIHNPGNCTVPANTPVVLSGSGLASINLAGLIDLSAAVVWTGTETGTLKEALGPGATIDVRIFPAGLNVTALGDFTLTVLGSSAGFSLDAGVGGIANACNLLPL